MINLQHIEIKRSFGHSSIQLNKSFRSSLYMDLIGSTSVAVLEFIIKEEETLKSGLPSKELRHLNEGYSADGFCIKSATLLGRCGGAPYVILSESQKGGGKEEIPTLFTGSLIARPSSPRPPSAALMAGRYESNPFDEEEVNPFADRKSVPPAYNSRLSPLPHEPAGFFNGGGATVDIPLDSSNDSRKKEKELQAKEAELRRREQVISSL
ncbi:Secretory carrier-associated membrane protein [Platanthera zijinensis]|uniref:Secretory carrier-associated membrane protein n=1 Tax=Platanthera zijinensis TaxID=2320716 RepID=A0AAP0BIL9_9ASPA